MSTPILYQWKNIARYLGVSPRTARSWARTKRLPVHKIGERSVLAYRAELNAWVRQHNRKGKEAATCGNPVDVRPAQAML